MLSARYQGALRGSVYEAHPVYYINEIHVTNKKVAECREGAQVSAAMIHLLLLFLGLPYIHIV